MGAGASVEAGLPVLNALTEEVAHGLESDARLRTLYERLWRGDLLAHEAEARNVEDVLTAVDALAAARLGIPQGDPQAEGAAAAAGDEEPIAAERGRALGPRDFALLGFSVRKLIWRRLSQFERASYLDGFQGLLDAHGSLFVASLNNDLVIETWAEEHGLRAERGFRPQDGEFDSLRLEDEQAPLRLAKLHGSVDWTFEAETGLRELRGRFRTAGGTIPMRTPLPEVAVVFPSRVKVLQAQPLRELLGAFDRRLRSAQVLVVVGCQLADSHILESIVEACRRNPELRVLVVDPGGPEAVDRVGKEGRGLGLAGRIDWLPRGLGEALSNGYLSESIERLLRGRVSPGREVVLTLEGMLSAGTSAAPQQLLTNLLDSPVPSMEWEDLRTMMAQRQPPQEAYGPIADGVHRLSCAALGPESSGRDEVRRAMGELLDTSRDLAQAKHPTEANGRFFFLRGTSPDMQIGRLRTDWSVEPVAFTGATEGLAVEGGHAFYFRKGLFGREGLAVLRRLDLETGKSSWRLLRRDGGGIGMRQLLRTIGEVRRGSPAGEAKELLRSCGFLSWPTTVRILDPGRLVVVESVEASIVEAETARVLLRTGRGFLNLTEAACAGPNRIYLLEGGFVGEGRLLLWRPEDDEVQEVVAPLRRPGGLAYDPDAHRLLLTLGEAGTVLEVALTADGLSRGAVRTVVKGLPAPRWICRFREGHYLVSTRWGLMGLTIPQSGGTA